MSAMIDLDAVTKRFAGKRDVTALDAVTLAIPRGEMVSIIGPPAPANPLSSTSSADSIDRPLAR
jgi:ABC-type phosphate/phosphonate transport system, ATPase component